MSTHLSWTVCSVRSFVGAIMASIVALGCASAAEDRGPLTVNRVIYTGDIFTSADLARLPGQEGRARGPGHDPMDVVGKRARRTILPGAEIQPGDFEEARVIQNGAPVRIVLQAGSIRLEAVGQALENGATNAVVRVRNMDTGRVVEGQVQPDGSVLVGGRQ